MKRLWFIVVSLLVLSLPSSASASSVKYDVSSSYTLEADTVVVSHQFTLSGAVLGDQIVRVPGRSQSFEITGLSDYEKTDSTAHAKSIPYRSTDIKLKLGSKTNAKVSISYKTTDLHADYKQADSVFVPPLDLAGEITNQSISLTAPLDLELGNIIGAEIDNATTVGGEQTYIFKQQGGFKEPIVLQLGSDTSAEVQIESKLENTGWWWKTKSIVLPLDTNQQRSYIKSITPKPSSVRVDKDGNIIADFLLRPRQTIRVSATADVLIEQKLYDLDNESGFGQIEQSLISDYTSSSDLWPDSGLNDLDLDADKLREESVISAIQQVHQAIINKSPEFSETTDFNIRSKKKDIKTWTSIDYSDRMIGALRGLGIPARLVGGVITDNQMTVFEQPTKAAWVEAYVPDIGWVTVDPVLGELTDNFFGQSGLQKVAFIIWGVSDHIPEFQNDSVSVKYSETTFPESSFKSKVLSGQNYFILPGVSVLRTVANMPAGVIVDNVSVRAQGGDSVLGSLAPLQQKQSFRFIFGSSSWQSIPAKLMIDGDAVSKATIKINYFVAIVELLLLGIILWFMLKWRKKRREPIVLHDDDSRDYVIEGQDLLHGRTTNQDKKHYDPLRDDAPPGP